MGIVSMLKYAVNSTIGTGHFMPLDEFIKTLIVGDEKVFTENATLNIPASVDIIYITACGAGGGGGGGSYNAGGGGGGGYASNKAGNGGNGGNGYVKVEWGLLHK